VSVSYTVGDTSPPLSGVLTSGGAPAGLAGAMLSVRIRKPDGTLIARPPTTVNAATGAWTLAWLVGDLAVAGGYQVEVKVTWAGTPQPVQTFGPARFYVNADI